MTSSFIILPMPISKIIFCMAGDVLFVFLLSDILRAALELDPDSALEQTLRKHIMKNLLKKVVS